MLNKAHIKTEIAEIAEKINLAASNVPDLNNLQSLLYELNEKIVLLKYLESPLEEKPSDSAEQQIPPEIFPDVQQQTKKEKLTDLFGNEIPLHEKISKSKDDQSPANPLKKERTGDLKVAIGINEKYRFINELFDGSDNEYNIALNQINSFFSKIEADNYLANLKDVYKWSNENGTTAMFAELVYRRFL